MHRRLPMALFQGAEGPDGCEESREERPPPMKASADFLRGPRLFVAQSTVVHEH